MSILRELKGSKLKNTKKGWSNVKIDTIMRIAKKLKKLKNKDFEFFKRLKSKIGKILKNSERYKPLKGKIR